MPSPCKLALILPLLLVTLPSLFFSLITFSILAFFLLLPIAIALSIIHLLSSVLSRYPIDNNSYGEVICAPKDAPVVEYRKLQESFEFDDLEVPRLDDSEEEEEVSADEEQEKKIMKELEGMSCEELCRFIERFGSVQTDGFMSFYEVLSFWRSKERPSRGN